MPNVYQTTEQQQLETKELTPTGTLKKVTRIALLIFQISGLK